MWGCEWGHIKHCHRLRIARVLLWEANNEWVYSKNEWTVHLCWLYRYSQAIRGHPCTCSNQRQLPSLFFARLGDQPQRLSSELGPIHLWYLSITIQKNTTIGCNASKACYPNWKWRTNICNFLAILWCHEWNNRRQLHHDFRGGQKKWKFFFLTK